MKSSSGNCKKPKASELAPVTQRGELEVLRQKASELALKSPEKAARILTEWMNPRASLRSNHKKTG